MTEVILYTTRYCPYCVRARQLLDSKGVAYTNIAVDSDRNLREEMERLSGAYTVPQIWINGQHIGGCDELMALERAGQLDPLLTAE